VHVFRGSIEKKISETYVASFFPSTWTPSKFLRKKKKRRIRHTTNSVGICGKLGRRRRRRRKNGEERGGIARAAAVFLLLYLCFFFFFFFFFF
jgi:hypothetical protein